jgi:PhnB protein
MAASPIPEGPRITPYLLYEDVAAALEWLARAFGFEEHGERFTTPEGTVSHAAMKLGDGVVMMGCPGPSYRNPKRLGQATQHLYIYVEDVDAHFERARAAGADILQEPKDQFYGDRTYAASDPEGHSWYFSQHVRDVSPEEMQRASGRG